jgi:hypothetical protein
VNAVEKAKLAQFKRDVSMGIKSLDDGRFKTYSDSDLMRLANKISRSGRIRLNALALKAGSKALRRK